MSSKVKCKECGYEDSIENFPTTRTYSQDEDGNIDKDSAFICPKCDAEGDQYFDIIEQKRKICHFTGRCDMKVDGTVPYCKLEDYCTEQKEFNS